MARWTTALVLGAAMAAGAPAAADGVCRPNTLGTVSCPVTVPPPRARPPGGAPVQALDKVRARERAPEPETFIPARRTNKLGGMVIDSGDTTGFCRADTLGNLTCR